MSIDNFYEKLKANPDFTYEEYIGRRILSYMQIKGEKNVTMFRAMAGHRVTGNTKALWPLAIVALRIYFKVKFNLDIPDIAAGTVKDIESIKTAVEEDCFVLPALRRSEVPLRLYRVGDSIFLAMVVDHDKVHTLFSPTYAVKKFGNTSYVLVTQNLDAIKDLLSESFNEVWDYLS